MQADGGSRAKRETTAISIGSGRLSPPAALPIVCLADFQQQSSNLATSTVSSQGCPSGLKLSGKTNHFHGTKAWLARL